MGTAYAPNANGSAQDAARFKLGDIRADDAQLRLNGLRESDASLRLGALREDDARVRLGTAYNRPAYFSSQDLRGHMGALREDDAGLRMGDIRADDAGLRLGNYADQDNAGAFQSKMSGLGVRSRPMVVDRGAPRSVSGGGSGSSNAAAGYKNRNQYRSGGSPRATFHENLSPSTLFASGAIPMMSTRHNMGDVRADDAQLRLGDLGTRKDFHPRFPVKVELKGLGSGTHMLSGSQIAGLFDFLKANPSDSDNMARVRAISNWWTPVRNMIGSLPADKQNAAIAAISHLDTSVENIDFVVATYPAVATFDREQMNRMTRIEAAEPAISKVVADLQAFSGPGGAAGAVANSSILKTINGQANAITAGMTMQNVAIAGIAGAAGIGIIYVVIKALSKHSN
jgi:hypothetical protein